MRICDFPSSPISLRQSRSMDSQGLKGVLIKASTFVSDKRPRRQISLDTFCFLICRLDIMETWHELLTFMLLHMKDCL